MAFTDLFESPNGGIPDHIVQDPIGAMLLIIEHWQAGALGLALATGLFLVASIVLRLRSVMPALGTDRGGAIVAMVLGLCTAVGGTLYAGADLSIAVVLAGVLAAVSAVGSRQWLRRLLWPADGSGTPWLDWAWLRWFLGERKQVKRASGAPSAAAVDEHARRYPFRIEGVDEIGGLWRCNSGPDGMPLFVVLSLGTGEHGEARVYAYDHHCEEWESLEDGASTLVWCACEQQGSPV